jgi:rfaE bifunctional protein kinase chain/domain
MNEPRLERITKKYPELRIAVVGDFCLDRYLEIDPAKEETSIETGLPVHNVTKIRAQAGGAGTIVNNLSALGIRKIFPVGFSGNDGDGFEMREALCQLRGVHLDHLIRTDLRHTFCYYKPLVVSPGKPPVELNRLDIKNWSPTPAALQGKFIEAIQELCSEVDAFILMDQVDLPETGVIGTNVLTAIDGIIQRFPNMTVLGDSRRRLKDFPPCTFKVNRSEFCTMAGLDSKASLEQILDKASAIAGHQRRQVFVTLSEQGLLGAFPHGEVDHVPALPILGPIDIVGAGDAVTANLTVALASGATLRESLEIANAAASVVIHQLGTTGTANVSQLVSKLL